jgi:hypothetical protein
MWLCNSIIIIDEFVTISSSPEWLERSYLIEVDRGNGDGIKKVFHTSKLSRYGIMVWCPSWFGGITVSSLSFIGLHTHTQSDLSTECLDPARLRLHV